MGERKRLEEYIPEKCQQLLNRDNTELRSAIPELARDWERMMEIESVLQEIPSNHQFCCGDSRDLGSVGMKPAGDGAQVPDESVHLVVTSPPYFDIKDYSNHEGQLGSLEEYNNFSEELHKVWKECYDKLVVGGRMCVVVGDVLQSRQENGRHRVLPLHAEVQRQCMKTGFDCLTPIIWAKVGNASLEAGGNSRFLGKPYEPGALIKNDIEYILMFRKSGGYRSPSVAKRVLSTIQVDNYRQCFNQIWGDIAGESKNSYHPAPFPKKLAERLIRMFSFVGDTVLDPFAGIGSTAVAASDVARDSINIEIDPKYISRAEENVKSGSPDRQHTTTRSSDF